ncbi:hypothetical protein HPB50_020204 [Hyalomma asiaticum]|uniref:Uncharacterized protein n=1 Tax=Hyalomma asiaticum TaxID=266040 RepID=A0ACB7TAZ7_HYAAI|nr:hypothetical protein HPB50_020204 [Hyalomma asiaticum]
MAVHYIAWRAKQRNEEASLQIGALSLPEIAGADQFLASFYQRRVAWLLFVVAHLRHTKLRWRAVTIFSRVLAPFDKCVQRECRPGQLSSENQKGKSAYPAAIHTIGDALYLEVFSCVSLLSPLTRGFGAYRSTSSL